jgi:DNA-binding SARP family transcriptional activator
MEFRILGPTELWSARQRCDLGPAKVRSGLAILLLTPRTIVPAETLIDRLWDTSPPAKARDTLSVYMARLRACLRDAIGDQVRLAGRASGYVLDVDPEVIDLHRFRQLRRQADALRSSGEAGAAAGLLRQADALWQGQALAGIRGDWVARMRDSLEEERRAALRERIECDLELGKHADLVGDLRGLLAQYPLDETLVAHQMTALYGSGRPADALSLYRDTRERLVEEQGAEPGAVLADLHQRMLSRDPGLAVRARRRTNADGPLAPLPSPLPQPEPAAATALATRTPVAVLEALPDVLAGAEESVLADKEEVAKAEFAYRSLEPVQQRLFRRLGLNPCPDVSFLGATALGGQSASEAEAAIKALLDHGLLTTAAGDRYEIPAALRAYASELAEEVDPAADRRHAVGRLLDYYLATADRADRVLLPFRHRERVSVRTPPTFVPALGSPAQATDWLESEWRNMLVAVQYAGRHEWQQQCADLAHALAGFVDIRGYWDDAIAAHTIALQACRDLAEPGRIARAALELSVVNQQAGRHEESLALAEEAAAIYQSLNDPIGLADALDQIGMACQRSARSREALAYFGEARTLYESTADSNGLAAALGHSAIACWQLGRYPDAMQHLREALATYRNISDRRGEAKALSNLGKMQLLSGLHRDALESFHLSLAIFTEIGGAQNQAILYQNIGNVHYYKGSYDKGLEAYRRSLAIYRAIGDRPDEVNLLNDIGAIYQSAECYDEALTHYRQARECAAEIGSAAEQVTAMRGIADARRGSGRYAPALADYHAALDLARQIGDPYEEAKILEGIAEATLGTRKPYAARIVFRQALDIYERLGVPEAESAKIRMETTDPAFGRRSS